MRVNTHDTLSTYTGFCICVCHGHINTFIYKVVAQDVCGKIAKCTRIVRQTHAHRFRSTLRQCEYVGARPRVLYPIGIYRQGDALVCIRLRIVMYSCGYKKTDICTIGRRSVGDEIAVGRTVVAFLQSVYSKSLMNVCKSRYNLFKEFLAGLEGSTSIPIAL